MICAPLIAAGVVDLILLLLFLVIPAILKALNGLGRPQVPPPQRRRPPRVPPAAGENPPPASPREALQAEIDQFLRRAQEGQASGPRSVPQQPSRSGNPVPAEIAGRTETRRRKPRPEGKVVVAEPARRRLADEASALEAHLHETFDHDLGSLAPSPSQRSRLETADAMPGASGASGAEGVSMAAGAVRTTRSGLQVEQLRRLLRDPQGMRQAMVLAEILRRPQR